MGLYGDLREIDSHPILAAAVCGVLRCSIPDNVTLVNARALAEEKRIDVIESTSSAKVAFSNLMAIRLKTSERDFSVAGTLFGPNHLRLVDVDGVEVDAIPQGHVLYVKNDDTPGVVGQIGTLLGRRSVNIARSRAAWMIASPEMPELEASRYCTSSSRSSAGTSSSIRLCSASRLRISSCPQRR